MNILEEAELREIQRRTDKLIRSATVSPKQEFKDFSIAKAIIGMSRESLPGYEREVLEEFAHREGQHFDKQRITLPFSLFRDLSKGVASAGGYLVSTETMDAVDILRPFSVTVKAGIIISTGLVGDQVIPKTTVKSTPSWIPSESTSVTASTPVLSQTGCTPKTASIIINFSRQLSIQANAETFVRRELLRTVGTAVDQAIISGSGASGQPLGIIGTPGIGGVTGTSLAYAGVTNMKRRVSDSNANDEGISFIASPGIRELLEVREKATNSGIHIWDNDRVASRPAYVSTDVPSATLICGSWSSIWLGVWSSGFVVEINPYDSTGFKTGTIQARILVSLDVCILHPAGFCKAESIT